LIKGKVTIKMHGILGRHNVRRPEASIIQTIWRKVPCSLTRMELNLLNRTGIKYGERFKVGS
jgi:hypothetical protein